MRPIDADAYVTVMLYDDEKEEFYEERMTIAEALDRYTSEGCQPTIEPKRGEWIKSETDRFICSACGSGYRNQPTCMGKPMFEYCPICGAKMDGEREVE